MNKASSGTFIQLRSLIRASGQLELSLVDVPMPIPGAAEVLVRIDAAPINPSDQGLLFGAADMTTARASGSLSRPVVTADIPAAAMAAMAGRVDQSMPVGNEGAGVVVETGSSESARRLLGKKVAIMAGAMYAQYRCVQADQCLVLADDSTVEEGASAFVNPLTVLGMVETMRREGHRALVHTAAASNLGQMLVRLCATDGIPLVNVVRTDKQATLLRELGAAYVCNSQSSRFAWELEEAIVATGATLGFDATGGGTLAGDLLSAMERAAGRAVSTYSRYGSSVHKQVYLYGGLDPRPTELRRDYGMAWGIGGWLVMNFLQKIGADAAARVKKRAADELRTTFASRYSRTIALAEVLRLETLHEYRQRATGGKFLIIPRHDAESA